MNKVFQINLGGTPFTIDEDAYEHLNEYLGALHKHFRGTEGYKEITTDIEARMAELFTESMGQRSIVSLADVTEAIQRMGRPEDFGADPLSDPDEKQGTESKKEYRTGRKLYRDNDESMVGGVAAGIAAYFGIADPIWIRALFVIMVLSGGFGLPLYIILWIIVPEAKTAGDRLAMRGKPINVDNITRIVREEFDHISEKVSELSEEWGNKKKGPKTKAKSQATVAKEIPIEDGDNFSEEAPAAEESSYFAAVDYSEPDWYERPRRRSIGERIFRAILLLIVVALMIWLAIAWFAIIVGAFVSYPYLGWIFPGQEVLTLLGMFNTLFVIGIPIAGIVMLLSRFLYRSRVASGWRWGLLVLWFANLCSLAIVGSRLGSQFVADADNQQEIGAESFAADTLRLSAYDIIDDDAVYIFDSQLAIDGHVLRTPHVHVDLRPSGDDQWHLIRHSYSRGSSRSDAQRRAAQIIAPLKFEPGYLKIPTSYEITKADGFKGQHIRFELLVPEGVILEFDPSFFQLSDYLQLSDNAVRPYQNQKAIWRMDSEGLSCIDCSSPATEEGEDQRLSFQDFEEIEIHGKMKVMIDRDNEYGVRLTGPETGLAAVSIEQTNGKLQILGPSEEMEGKPIRLYINLPKLQALTLADTDDVRLRDFQQERLALAASGDFEVKSYGTFTNLLVNLSRECELELRGQIGQLEGMVIQEARLDGNHAEITKASIEKSDDAKVELPENTNI